MQRSVPSPSALALTALIMAAGTSAQAQFQFLTDRPFDASENQRRATRVNDGYAPAVRTAPAPEPEKKGFFGRLFSRDEEPRPPQRQYAPPANTYVRDGVRYSDPAGYANDPRLIGAQTITPGTTAVIPPNGQARPLATHVVSDGFRYAPGAEPVMSYNQPVAPAPSAPRPTASPFRVLGNDTFSGQLPNRGETAPPNNFNYSAPAPAPAWPDATDPRVIGAQTVQPNTTVMPPSGNARPLATHVVSDGVRYAPGAVPEGYPAPSQWRPANTTRGDQLDRPGIISRFFSSSPLDEAPRAQDTVNFRPPPVRYTPPPAPEGYPQPELAPRALPVQPQPQQPFNNYVDPRYVAPNAPVPAPSPAPAQDPFSGQRPSSRRTIENAPTVPPNVPAAPTGWPAPRSSLDAPPDAVIAALPANLSPAEARAFSPSTRPEDRRYLMYLYAKTGRADLAEPLAQDLLARDPVHQEALLAMSALFTEKKDAPRALHYATRLQQAYPDTKEALYYYGAANQLAGNYAEAAAVLRYLRLEKFGGQPFPYQLDLAAAEEKSGHWRAQMNAYEELLDQNQVDDATRMSVRRVLEPLQREHGNLVSAQATAYLLKSSALWQERVGVRTQLSDRTQLYAEALHEDVLVRRTAILTRRWGTDTEGSAGLQTTWDRRWVTDLWAGGSPEGIGGGARALHRFSGPGSAWLEFYGNERARDGLLMNSLNGRQHRVSLAGNYLLAERFQPYGTLTAREVVLDGTDYARGWQGSWGMDFLARRESPDFKIGYRGAYQATSRQTGDVSLVAPALQPGLTLAQQTQALDSLTLHWLHREGLHATLRDRLWGPLYYHVQGGADYAFERHAMEYSGRVGLAFRPRKSLEFSTELAYTTGAATADGASDLWEASVGAKWWF